MLAQQGRHRAFSRSETAGQPHVHFSEGPLWLRRSATGQLLPQRRQRFVRG
jgi:hypothetical protein